MIPDAPDEPMIPDAVDGPMIPDADDGQMIPDSDLVVGSLSDILAARTREVDC